MKKITREVTVYTYVFANIDLETGNVTNQITLRSVEPVSRKRIESYCREHNDCVLIHRGEETAKYSMPVDLFVRTVEEYTRDTTTNAAEENYPDN